jgi:hypothetical protein
MPIRVTRRGQSLSIMNSGHMNAVTKPIVSSAVKYYQLVVLYVVDTSDAIWRKSLSPSSRSLMKLGNFIPILHPIRASIIHLFLVQFTSAKRSILQLASLAMESSAGCTI